MAQFSPLFVDQGQYRTDAVIGQNLSHFKIIAKLGEGGMGEVYRAEDTKLGREVAIKVLPVELANDAERLERFQREARALAALDHPNIVAVHSVEEADGIHFLTMGLVDGEPLDQSVSEGGMPLASIFELAIPLADAVAAAHEKGIVHRDLKPSNVMLGGDGRVKILDFGLAKAMDPAAERDPESGQKTPSSSSMELMPTLTANLTQQGMVMGTVPYMAPEQVEGKTVDHRVDIFSLGVLFYEMATGERPFQGDTSAGLMSSILKDVPKPVVETRSDLPRHFGRILSRCLEKNPEDRYQTAKDLLVDLRSLKREAESGLAVASLPRARRQLRWPALLAGAVAIFAVIAGGLYRSSGPTDRIHSLAVLPFEHGTGDPDTEYFSDGVTETIISSLSQLPNLKVISRTSAFHYKGQAIDPKAVGSELGVDALVLGRIVQRGNDLTISAELVRANDSRQIWGAQYQRQTADVFNIQREISQEISSALRVELTSDQAERLTKQHTENSSAYQAYLKGRHHWNQRTEEGFRRAIGHFQDAIKEDPDYALAYSGLADCYGLLGYYSLPPREAYPQARAAAERALDLDDSLAEAHTSLAWVKQLYDWDFAAADREFRSAIELNPSYATAHHWYAVYFLVTEQRDAAVEQARRAVELDPLSLIINTEVGNWLAFAGRYQEAEEQFQKTLDLDPNFPHLHIRWAWSYALQGRFDDAVSANEKGVELFGAPYGLGQLGHAYAKVGRTGEAREVLSRLEELATTRYVSPAETALVYAGLGDRDRSFALLGQAYEERVADMLLLRYRFAADLGDDPRFDDLLRRVGLE